jgi:hypothetical protein
VTSKSENQNRSCQPERSEGPAFAQRLSLLLETQRRVRQHINATLDALHQATRRE